MFSIQLPDNGKRKKKIYTLVSQKVGYGILSNQSNSTFTFPLQ